VKKPCAVSSNGLRHAAATQPVIEIGKMSCKTAANGTPQLTEIFVVRQWDTGTVEESLQI
jgi:hypothetical protein